MLNTKFELQSVIAVNNILGEGVSWRPSDQTIWWTDIFQKTLFCLEWGKNVPQRYPLPQRLASFGFVAGDDNQIIAAFETGFALLRLDNLQINWLHRPDELLLGCGRRLNDGRVGPDGAFWAGAMLERDDVKGGQASTGLYRLDENYNLEFKQGGFEIFNGLAWSPCGTVIYCSDSPKGLVYKSRFCLDTGCIEAFEVFTMPSIGVPDGAITDSLGGYWCALWGGGCVACYDDNGSEIHRISMSVPQPTIPVFGGPSLTHLIVASASLNLSKSELESHPKSGNLFIFSTHITGCEPSYYRPR